MEKWGIDENLKGGWDVAKEEKTHESKRSRAPWQIVLFIVSCPVLATTSTVCYVSPTNKAWVGDTHPR